MDLAKILRESKDVEFQDVYYSVSERKSLVSVKESRRQILNGVSGVFKNGQLSAIMGPSGAGKSSLLNAISGYRTSGVEGYIKLNRLDSCYITQEDHHQSLFSVEELMKIACALKLKSKKSYDDIITDILLNLNLNHRRDTKSEFLSGGEKKRLSIALELVANPTIFFLDEPTSGLDEVTAGQCIRLLRSLAQQGRTIVCTIHQPSANIFSLFDSVFVLAKGFCVYQGGPTEIIPFLSQVNLNCPKTYSPSDYIIEVCDSDDGKNIPKLSELTQNGKLIYSSSCDNSFYGNGTGIYNGNGSCDIRNGEITFKNALTSFFMETSTTKYVKSPYGITSTNILEKMKAFSRRIKNDNNYSSVSSLNQFYVLFKLMLLKITRNRIALYIQLIHHLICGLTFGLIFYKAGNDGARMFDHLKFCIGCILVVVYTQVMVPVLSYPSEVKLVKKECFNRWYRLEPYYLALTLSRIPFQILFSMLFLTCTYWMSGLPPQIWRFGLFSAVSLVTSFVAEGMGLAIGATFSVTNGAAVGPLVIAPLMGLAIYGFDFASEIPMLMYVIMKISYIRVGAVALVLSVFGFNRPALECNELYCHFADPRVLLRFLRIEHVSIWNEFGFLIIIMIFFRVLLYISLKIRCKT